MYLVTQGQACWGGVNLPCDPGPGLQGWVVNVPGDPGPDPGVG